MLIASCVQWQLSIIDLEIQCNLTTCKLNYTDTVYATALYST